ncbi:hypothetical protein FHS18_006108 [Paenibacillus phyllosphaerae]|uniref:Dockerin domain-containing protein n=1 Tax=Paenibacillus phyllosphaerae TaxID=274593 RepID=A0A7W5B405_9BACL|nr:cohesin domain-containing protein [Paenibacillus phyllosphaerae]MBB3113992.1 hypothetical protein [Paenibacillus phyllosphaerae]
MLRRRMIGAVTAASLLLGSAAISPAAASAVDLPEPVKSEPYSWGRVKVVGGGFIPGIIYNESEKDLIYARTDMGGAYRWDKTTGTWKQLLEFVGFDEWNMLGVESLATDPVDPNRVYIAAGTYTNDWTDMNGVILRSTDRGETWQRTELPFKFGGNMPGRSMGERLSIDPNDNSILYFAARGDNGLWRSTDYGATWSKVESFTAPADVKEYYGSTVGPVWVTFDKSTGSAGSKTQTIYVGVADSNTSIYRSTDGGQTWEAVPGQPKQGFVPHHGTLSSNGNLYITYNYAIGPYDGDNGSGKLGSVWKLDTKSGVWTDISPTGAGSTDTPYGGLAVDAQNPDTLMVASMNKWWPDDQIYRSTDGGATWAPFWTIGNYPERNNRYAIDYSLSPWLDWGEHDTKPLPEQAPKLGWMIGDLEIDPFNSDRMMYGTGATLYGSDDLTKFDQNETINIEVMADGIEETAVLGLISPSSGAPLLSSMGDIGGFRHEDLDKAPEMLTNPVIGSSTDLDFAELNPNIVVRVGNGSGSAPRMGVSTDNGVTWTPAANAFSDESGANGGHVAVAADGSSIVWSPAGAPISYSTDLGATWKAAAGLPDGARVSADRVNPSKFYGLADGVFYVSLDGGATFTATAAAGLPTKLTSNFKAVPGQEGDIWIAAAKDNSDEESAYGLWHSTDSGQTFTKQANVEEAATIGFGLHAPGKTYPAMYSYAKVEGQYGVYRSDDGGANWIRINDDEHQFGSANTAITGDARVYGRVYIATNGLGIVKGESAAQPAADTTLTGPSTVKAGQTFQVNYGLAANGHETVAQDITITYDSSKLTYTEATSLQPEQFVIAGIDSATPGTIRILGAHVGVGASGLGGELLRLGFQAKADAADGPSTIAVTNVVAGNAGGSETSLSGGTLQIAIRLVDSASLTALIAEATTVHDQAVEGNRKGQYPSGSKAKLQAAIDAAAEVASDEGATQAEVADAVTALTAELKQFRDSVITRVPGDTNQDDKVSIGDLAIVAKAYGMKKGDEGWDGVKGYDFNGDDIIDVEDLVILARKILDWE